jgi:RNA polymerase sigma factor (sigma-70 family)
VLSERPQEATTSTDFQFEDFFHNEYGRVFAGLRIAFQDYELSEDAAEEAFARAWARWRRVRNMEHPKAWVVRVAFNCALRERRKGNREARLSPSILFQDSVPSHAPAIDQLVDMERRLRELSGQQRSTLVLRYYLDLSVRDSARALKVTEGTVKKYSAEALAKLGRKGGSNELGGPGANKPLLPFEAEEA